MPARYPSVRLGELLTLDPAPGQRQRKDGQGPVIPYVTTSAVSGGAYALALPPEEVTYGDPKDRVTSNGDLLLVSRGVERVSSVGCATVRFDPSAAFAQSLIRLRVDSLLIHPDYLRLFLTSRQGGAALAVAATGSVISNLRKDALAEVEIRLPSLEVQLAVVASMQVIEAGLGDLEETTSLVRDLHDALREGFTAGLLGPGDLPDDLEILDDRR